MPAGSLFTVKTISMTNSPLKALVDDEDYALISSFRWQINPKRKSVYRCTARRPVQHTIYIHRQVMNAQIGQYVDHINHDFLDNRKSNLRIATNQQNSANQRIRCFTGKSSRFKGVSYHSDCGKWSAQITINYKIKYLGLFANESDAAKRYNEAAKEHFGEFAYLNPL